MSELRGSNPRRSNEPDFRAIFEGVPTPILVLLPDLTILAANDAYLKATMTLRSEIAGRALFEVFTDNPDDPTASGIHNLRASLHQLLITKSAQEMLVQTYRIRRPESVGGGFEERHWLLRNSPVLGAMGEVEYIIHQAENVTEPVFKTRQGLEPVAPLEHQENAFEQFFGLSLDFLCISGADGFCKRVNPAFDQLGYSREELLTRPFRDFIHPDDQPRAYEEFLKLAGGCPSIELEIRILCSDGSIRWVRWTSAPSSDGLVYSVGHDVTARYNNALHNRQTNQFLEALLENIPHMIFVKGAEHLEFISFNRAGEELLGVERGELLGKTDFDLFPMAEAEFFQLKDRETLRGGVLLDIPEETVQTRYGERYLRTKKVPILDSNGKPQYLLGISEDITELRKASELRARMAAIVESSDDAIVSKDLDGLITSWNPGAEKLYGYSAEEVMGCDVSLGTPPDASTGEQAIRSFLSTTRQVDHFETVAQRKDGREVHVSVRLSPIRDRFGQVIGISKISRDIGERKAAEAALAQKNDELLIAARIDRIGARIMVALSQHDELNEPASQVLKILAEEAQYRPLAFYDYDEWKGGLSLLAGDSLPPDYGPRKLRLGEGLVGEAAAQRTALFIDAPPTHGFSLDTGVGLLHSVAHFAVPLIYRDKLLGVLAGGTQIPLLERERNWLTQVAAQVAVGLHSIRQFVELQELSHQLNVRSRKIESQNRELARANRLKSEFLASMSHELRTPLNAIIGFSEVLKDGLLGQLSPPQLDYSNEIFQAGRHLLSLINDILDLSKIEAGKMELEVEPVEIQQLVANALTIVKERAITEGVTLTKSVPDDISPLHADGRKLRQVVYNLLSNAVKFTPRGGSVHLEVKQDDANMEIAVIDSGIGISADELPHLFQPFEQLEGGIARRFEGTGLGLVLVKNLVEMHGGSVGVSSKVGQGSRFWVRMPRTLSTENTKPVPLSKQISGLERASSEHPVVLVVDDDVAAISLASRWLEKASYRVVGASNCDEAWQQIQSHQPDVILLDILFENGPDGWVFLERLRGSSIHSRIPVVVISIVADLERGLSLGALHVLQKPFSGPELLQVVGELALPENGVGEGARILVVDDDPRSVEHVSQRLEGAGMRVTRAHGGEEALDALEGEVFDAMILDLMMPKVSGFDVVREVRQRVELANFPIIILTAKVLEPGERRLLERSVYSVLAKEEWNGLKFVREIQRALWAKHSLDGMTELPSDEGDG